nr:immunoglobulin heavy chain junction region [Mus musculus]
SISVQETTIVTTGL